LTSRLHELVIKRDWAEKQADHYWEKAKDFEAKGWEDLALKANTLCAKEIHRVSCLYIKIDEVETMIDNLS
jgi:hypothetical protein